MKSTKSQNSKVGFDIPNRLHWNQLETPTYSRTDKSEKSYADILGEARRFLADFAAVYGIHAAHLETGALPSAWQQHLPWALRTGFAGTLSMACEPL
jgi:hypothetical protein